MCEARNVIEETGLDDTVARLATYAWEGTWSGQDDDLLDALSELSTAVEATRGRFLLPDGTELFSTDDAAQLLLLQNAATARRELAEDGLITVETLAALAGVAEKTVRMATSPRSANPLKVTKQGHWTVITASDALAWLQRRGDFNPTRMDAAMPVLSVTADVAGAIKKRMAQVGTTPDAVARSANLNKAAADAFAKFLAGSAADASAKLRPSHLKAVADALEMGDPVGFATKAYRLIALEAADRAIQRELGSH